MVSTFMGMETAKRGLAASQNALYTLSNNVSNANTPGYTRQRVNFSQSEAFPSPGMNSPMVAGQIGTGVSSDSVQRIRDSFLDAQFRTQANKVGYYATQSESLTKMEGIMNEPTDTGLQSTLNQFWNSLQTLTSNSENTAARAVVASRGEAVADTLNYYYNSLTSIQEDIGTQMGVKENEINSTLKSINELNEQISQVEPHGNMPNDLYDKRDSLVDRLSQLVNVKVTSAKPDDYGNPSPVSEGLYNIELITSDGKSYTPPITLVGANRTGILGYNKVEVIQDGNKGVTAVKFGDKTITDVSTLSGELGASIKSYGYSGKDGKTIGTYPDMIDQLNKMTETFVNEFNRIHAAGFGLGPDASTGVSFFTIDPTNPIKSIKVNQAIIDNPKLIAAASNPDGASADNGNAQLLANLKKLDFSKYEKNPDDLSGSLDSFYSGIIGTLGVDSQNALRNHENSVILANSVDYNRQSVSAVSLDEEMADMIKYQQAYNASGRMITMMDELLDKVINGMGTGGR